MLVQHTAETAVVPAHRAAAAAAAAEATTAAAAVSVVTSDLVA